MNARAFHEWCAAHPLIRRAYAYEIPGDDAGERDATALYVVVDVEPVMDSEEILPVWLAHSAAWQRELQVKTACTVHLGWIGPYESAEFAGRSIVACFPKGMTDGH